MRILMTSKAGAGHVGPLVPFANAFRRAGAEVLVAVPREAAPIVRAARLPLWGVDDPPSSERDAIFAEVGGMRPETAGERVVGDVFARIDARAAFPGMLAACRAWRPDVVISEITEFAGPLAAEAIGVPTVCIGISQLARGESIMTSGGVLGAIDELRARFGLAPDPRGERMREARYVTLMPEALEDPATVGSYPALRFRDVPPGRAGRLGDWWPGDHRPLVYVTFGSVAPNGPYFPDLYRAAIDAISQLSVRALVTIGKDRDPADLRPMSATVHVERWVPQQDVMPYADAMVCHGGSGTVTMGLAAGVPMVVLPLFADQPWNAERVAALGAGIALEGGAEAADGITNAVRRVLAEPSFRAIAGRVATEMQALPTVDTAVGVVRDLLGQRLAA